MTTGLRNGAHNQVYERATRDSSTRFRLTSVESGACMSHPISVAEIDGRGNGYGTEVNGKGTYFLDSRRDREGALTGKPWKSGDQAMRLRGLVKQ